MSRTNHPNKYNYDTHPYWKYQWWFLHGSSQTRREYNRRDRRVNKLRVKLGKEPVLHKHYLPWIWW